VPVLLLSEVYEDGHVAVMSFCVTPDERVVVMCRWFLRVESDTKDDLEQKAQLRQLRL